jgi:ComF family protein
MHTRFQFLRPLLHLFFPYTCCGCNSGLITEDVLFCLYCEAGMPLTHFEYFSCNPVEKIFKGRLEIQSAAAHVYFTGGSSIQRSLHLLKYKKRREIGEYFGRRMGKAILRSKRFEKCEVIIPLPLFSSREKKRGFNQANVIAEKISAQLHIPVITDVVIRTKKTETQTRKSRIQRWKNTESAFEIRNLQSVSGKHLLLVDDVITTGASLEACAQVLQKIPGVTISIYCMAFTVKA